MPAAFSLPGAVPPGVIITENHLMAQAWRVSRHHDHRPSAWYGAAHVCPFVNVGTPRCEGKVESGEKTKTSEGTWGGWSDAEPGMGGRGGRTGELFLARVSCTKIIKLKESRLRMKFLK